MPSGADKRGFAPCREAESTKETKYTRPESEVSTLALEGIVTWRSEQGQTDFKGLGSGFDGAFEFSLHDEAAAEWQQQGQDESQVAADFVAPHSNGQLHAWAQHQPCGIASGMLANKTNRRRMRFFIDGYLMRCDGSRARISPVKASSKAKTKKGEVELRRLDFLKLDRIRR